MSIVNVKGLFAGLALSLAFCSASIAVETTQDRANKIAHTWQNWVKQSGATASSIAISFKGKLVHKEGIGREATDPYPVASLSKAITGICIAKLVEVEKFTYETKLSDIVKDPAIDVKIGSLLAHSSGFTNDVTQSSLRWIKDRSKENLEMIVRRQLDKGERKAEGSLYNYNNSNYQMLGLAIAKVTGKTYEQACNDLVLKPVGVTSAHLNPPWRLMAGFGGWNISAVDYLKFVDHYLSNKGVMGVLPIKLPHWAFDGGAFYGVGVLFREWKGGFHYWHTGAWDWRGKPKKEDFSAFFAKWAHGWAVSVNTDKFPGWELMGQLDQSLWKASWQ